MRTRTFALALLILLHSGTVRGQATAGPSCPPNPAGGPDELLVTVGSSGSDIDVGVSGGWHNLTLVPGAKLRFCLSDCDASTTSQCTARGTTGKGSVNGLAFGPPIPVFAGGAPVCLVTFFADPVMQATSDVRTGAFDATATPIHLSTDVFPGTSAQVCPRCSGTTVGDSGICDSGANATQPCKIEALVTVNDPSANTSVVYPVSRRCLPAGNAEGAIQLTLPLTTGTSSLTGSKPCPGQTRDDACADLASPGTCTGACPDPTASPPPTGGIDQVCCSTNFDVPCFPTAPGTAGSIQRAGTVGPPIPYWPDSIYPKDASKGSFVATSCAPSSTSSMVDQAAGLPGPVAIILSAKQRWIQLPAASSTTTTSTVTSTTRSRPPRTSTTTTTTTIPGGSCQQTEPLASTACRVDALMAILEGAPAGRARNAALRALRRTRLWLVLAESQATQGPSKAGRVAVRHALRSLTEFQRGLRTRAGRRLFDPTVGQYVLESADKARGDLREVLAVH